MLAVSHDIVNAFNSLPWIATRAALTYHIVPAYLAAVIWNYLSGRSVEFGCVVRKTQCGVSQGSVLGPILWDMTYHAVLSSSLRAGVSLTCYVNDTRDTAGGREWGGRQGWRSWEWPASRGRSVN